MAGAGARAAGAALFLLGAVPAAPAPGASGRGDDSPGAELVVLTPRAAWSEDCVALAFGKGDGASLASRCQLLEAMADDIRRAAARADLGGAVVLDRDETLRRVTRMRRPPACPGPEACDLDTARLLAADGVVSARVGVAGGTWSARLEVRRVSSGRLVARATATGRDAPHLRASVRAATRRLLRAWPGSGTP